MPTDVVTFAASETAMRFREPYTTDGLNRKFFGVVPPGVYRGFRLEVDAGLGDRTVNVAADPETNDHLAVVATSTGYGLTLRKTGGDFLIDLSSYSSTTVIIALYSSYAVGATTSSVIRVFTQAEFTALSSAARDEIVAIGTVVVPVSGTIAATSISGANRDMTWMRTSPEADAWTPMVLNPDFEDQASATITAAAGGTSASKTVFDSRVPWWTFNIQTTATHGYTFGVDTTAPFRNTRHLRLQATSIVSPYTVTGFLLYPKTRPVWATERRFKCSFAYKTPVGFPVGGTIKVLALWASEDTASPTLSQTVLGTLDLSVSSSYKSFDAVFEPLIGARIFLGVALVNGDLYPAPSFTSLQVNLAVTPNELFHLDDFQIWMENPKGRSYSALDDSVALIRGATSMVFREFPFDSSKANVAMSYDGDYADDLGNQARLSFVRADEDSASEIQASIGVSGQVVAGVTQSGTGPTGTLQRKRAPFRAISANTYYKPIFESAHQSNDNPIINVYAKHTGPGTGYAFVIAMNCRWNETTLLWENQSLGGTAKPIKIEIGQIATSEVVSGIKFFTEAIGSATWSDTTWDESNFYLPAFFGTVTTDPEALEGSIPGAMVFGSKLASIGNDTSEFIARLVALVNTTSPTGAKSLVERIADSALTTQFTEYVHRTGVAHGREETWNAFWDHGSNVWIPTDATKACYRVSWNGSAVGGLLQLQMREAGSGSFWNTTWDGLASLTLIESGGVFGSSLLLGRPTANQTGTALLYGDQEENGPYLLLDTSNLSGTNPSGAPAVWDGPDPFTNRLYSKNIPKVFVRISTDGAGNVTILEAFGVSQVTITSGDIVISFANAFADTNFVPVAGSNSSAHHGVIAYTFTVSSIRMRFMDSTEAQVSAATNVVSGSMIIFGEQ